MNWTGTTLLPDETLKIEISDQELPILSAVATQAMKVLDDPSSTAKEFEALIRKDPSLAMRVLRVANSPLYATKVELKSLAQAATRLGTVELKKTITIAATGDVFPQNDEYARMFWTHAIATAFMASWISTFARIENADDCFLGGMLHDIGKVTIYRQEPLFYGSVIDEALEKKGRFYHLEKARVKLCSHESVGGMMAKKWNLDPKIVQAIRYHHICEEGKDFMIKEEAKNFVALISLANLMTNHLGLGNDCVSMIDPARSKPAMKLGISDTLSEITAEDIEKIIKVQMDSMI